VTTGGAAAHKGPIARALTENLALKGLALAASVVLFLLVRGTEDAEIAIVAGVAVVQPLDDDRVLVSDVPDQVRVTLRGSQTVLAALRRVGLPPLQVDLRQDTGDYYYFDGAELELPAGASVVQITPSAVPLRWVRREERRLRVEPLVEGEVAPGRVLGEVRVDPPEALVSGATEDVGRLSRLRTAAVDVSGLAAGRHVRRVPLGALPEHVHYADSAPVTVTLVVSDEVGSRSLGLSEVALVGVDAGRVRPTRVSVVVEGPRARIDALPSDLIVPSVDATGMEGRRGAQPATIVLRGVPDGLTARAEPSEVLVTIPRI
jgi:YbbR domain-containing protein